MRLQRVDGAIPVNQIGPQTMLMQPLQNILLVGRKILEALGSGFRACVIETTFVPCSFGHTKAALLLRRPHEHGIYARVAAFAKKLDHFPDLVARPRTIQGDVSGARFVDFAFGEIENGPVADDMPLLSMFLVFGMSPAPRTCLDDIEIRMNLEKPEKASLSGTRTPID